MRNISSIQYEMSEVDMPLYTFKAFFIIINRAQQLHWHKSRDSLL